jgi:hypothetical protein
MYIHVYRSVSICPSGSGYLSVVNSFINCVWKYSEKLPEGDFGVWEMRTGEKLYTAFSFSTFCSSTKVNAFSPLKI